MPPYSYALGDDAVQVFSRLSVRQRGRLLRVCEQLARLPHQSGDFQEAGATGRIYQLKLIDDLLITWWLDDAAREVRIVRLECVD